MPTSSAAERIKSAYLALLDEFPRGPITVMQIAQRAKVNRVTFYRLYESQEAVLIDILDEFDRINQAFMGELDPLENMDRHELPVRRMLELHRSNMPMLRTVLRSSMAPVLEKRIEDGIRNPVGSSGVRSGMLLSFYVAGVSKVICEWILGGCAESIDEMITFFRDSNAMLQPT